jgi:hypothetical protein
MDRADNDIVAPEKRGPAFLVKDVALLSRNVWELRDLLGIAGNRRDVMAAIREFLENAGTTPAVNVPSAPFRCDIAHEASSKPRTTRFFTPRVVH